MVKSIHKELYEVKVTLRRLTDNPGDKSQSERLERKARLVMQHCNAKLTQPDFSAEHRKVFEEVRGAMVVIIHHLHGSTFNPVALNASYVQPLLKAVVDMAEELEEELEDI